MVTEISETAGREGEGERERERKRRAGNTLVSGVDDLGSVVVAVVGEEDRAARREGDKAASTRLTEA